MCSVAKSRLILCDPMDCSQPGSSVHGISQARLLDWVAISSSRGSFRPRDQTAYLGLLHCRQILKTHYYFYLSLLHSYVINV